MKILLNLALIFALIINKIKSNHNPAFIKIIEYEGSDYDKIFFVPRHYQTTHGHVSAICQSYGMEFAMIESADEFQCIQKAISQVAGQFEETILIDGITPTPKSPTDWFFTCTGKKINFPIPWAPNEPNDFEGNEKCLSIKNRHSVWEINDIPCNETFSFACQLKSFESEEFIS